MKHKKHLSIALVALAITSGIAGCSNSASSTQSITVKATNTETDTQNTKDIKADFITKADAVSKKIDEASQKSGWMEPTDFSDVAADLQLLAVAVGMEHKQLIIACYKHIFIDCIKKMPANAGIFFNYFQILTLTFCEYRSFTRTKSLPTKHLLQRLRISK
ncbi:hypothetical protein [Bacillus hominis]|uniref:hypothetical protein n=1 Tax=Bacillus hominis TaxID=2817478 RepID=UPI001EE59B95|nr:hypothetical protein [Bacillus hominis]